MQLQINYYIYNHSLYTYVGEAGAAQVKIRAL